MKSLFFKLLKTDQDKATILIRFIIGTIFILEGIQKFVYSNTLGVGRFIKIGIPYAEVLAPMVGASEIIFGLFILIGFATRISSMPQIIIMVVALVTTKLSHITQSGFLTFSHEARNDLLMLFGLLFLLVKGSGAISIDQYLMKKG
jgi:putative oxidoreductase